MLEKIWKRETYNYLQHIEKPRIEKFWTNIIRASSDVILPVNYNFGCLTG